MQHADCSRVGDYLISRPLFRRGSDQGTYTSMRFFLMIRVNVYTAENTIPTAPKT
jgi:hypothetical protein